MATDISLGANITASSIGITALGSLTGSGNLTGHTTTGVHYPRRSCHYQCTGNVSGDTITLTSAGAITGVGTLTADTLTLSAGGAIGTSDNSSHHCPAKP